MRRQKRNVWTLRFHTSNTYGKVALLVCFTLSLNFFGAAVAEEMAPDFTLTDIDGAEFSLSDYGGKIVLLDFFATWCPTCRSEIAGLRNLHEEFSEDLVIISISTDPLSDTVETLQRFREDFSMNWTIARDTEGVFLDYGVASLPTKVIVGQEGDIKNRYVGPVDESVIIGEIVALIPEFSLQIFLPLLFLFTLLLVLTRSRHSAEKRVEAQSKE